MRAAKTLALYPVPGAGPGEVAGPRRVGDTAERLPDRNEPFARVFRDHRHLIDDQVVHLDEELGLLGLVQLGSALLVGGVILRVLPAGDVESAPLVLPLGDVRGRTVELLHIGEREWRRRRDVV